MEASDPASTGKEIPQQGLSVNVGMALREARERMGVSVSDIAERTKFAPRQVEALEANDFAHLPEATFLRGFVRSYARVLQLDEAALVSALPVEPSQQVSAKTSTIDAPFPTLQSLRRANMLWLAGALGVALVLGLFVFLHDGEPMVKQARIVVEPISFPASDAAAPPVAVVEVQPDKSSEQAKVIEATNMDESKKAAEASKTADSKQPVVEPETQVIPDPASLAVAKPPVPLEMLKRRPLHFLFSKDTWAEVIDVNGVILLSRTNQGGSEQWIGGPRRAPYNVSIAHPANVKLYYKGKEVDLSAYAAMDVAHIKVE